jgi:hypothetical protein
MIILEQVKFQFSKFMRKGGDAAMMNTIFNSTLKQVNNYSWSFVAEQGLPSYAQILVDSMDNTSGKTKYKVGT